MQPAVDRSWEFMSFCVRSQSNSVVPEQLQPISPLTFPQFTANFRKRHPNPVRRNPAPLNRWLLEWLPQHDEPAHCADRRGRIDRGVWPARSNANGRATGGPQPVGSVFADPAGAGVVAIRVGAAVAPRGRGTGLASPGVWREPAELLQLCVGVFEVFAVRRLLEVCGQ